MMCRDHQISDSDRSIAFIFYCHLGFAVRIQALNDPLLPYLGQTPCQAMGKIDWRRHQLRIHVIEPCFFGGIAEHHALVASALLFKQPLACGDTLGNVRALRFQVDLKALTFPKVSRSEEHTSELQSRSDLVCRLLLEKKKNKT